MRIRSVFLSALFLSREAVRERERTREKGRQRESEAREVEIERETANEKAVRFSRPVFVKGVACFLTKFRDARGGLAKLALQLARRSPPRSCERAGEQARVRSIDMAKAYSRESKI